MKLPIKSLLVATSLLAVSFSYSCGYHEEKFNMPDITYQTYDNKDFSDYTQSGQIQLENLSNQWENYGIGDPYVMRFNGRYFLYCSTRDNAIGIRCWESKDLINWNPVTAPGFSSSEAGLVSNDPATKCAYAPEVYYYNGTFYMYTSPSGNGHIILSADSPYGPFKAISNEDDKRIDMNKIDGTVFIDDDEKMYFLNAGDGGIQLRSMDSMTEISSFATKLQNANIGGWTEGPGLFKRDGIYYLTYTGTNVLSPSYRINYSSEDDQSLFGKKNSFNKGSNSNILLSTAEDYQGLGHSSTVLGPDMSSYYIAYHKLNTITTNGPYRSFNIDRLYFNGTEMYCGEGYTGSIKPTLPTFSVENGEALITNNTFKLSNIVTTNSFTAEYNYIGTNTKCIFNYVNDDNYAYILLSLSNHTIDYYNVINGVETKVSTGTINNDYDDAVIHTIRVSYDGNKLNVYFDNLLKINGVDAKLDGGKIGYANANIIFYTAFSNVGNTQSDQNSLKLGTDYIGSSNYLADKAFDKITSYQMSNKSKLNKVSFDTEVYYQSEKYLGAYELTLGAKKDFARYLTYVKEDGTYAISLTYDKKYAGKKIGLQIDNGEVKTIKLPKINCEEGVLYVTTTIKSEGLSTGEHLITFYGNNKGVGFIHFRLDKTSIGKYEFTNSLKDVVTNGAIYSTMFKLPGDGHESRQGSLNLCYFGDTTLHNFETEVQIKFVDDNLSSCGILLRANNFANSSKDNSTSLQGYYVSIDSHNISLSKYDHGQSKTNIKVKSHGISASKLEGGFQTLKASIIDNTITVYLNGDKLFSYTDYEPFICGHTGIYSDGADAIFKNIKVNGK